MFVFAGGVIWGCRSDHGRRDGPGMWRTRRNLLGGQGGVIRTRKITADAVCFKHPCEEGV